MSINLKKLKMFLKDPDKKPYYKIFFEALRAGIKEKELPRHYFSKLLYRKDVNNYLDYVGSFRGVKIVKDLNKDNDNAADILTNKLLFDYFFKDKEIRIPKMLGYNIKNVFYNNNQKIEVRNKEEFIQLMKRWNSGNDVFCKPIKGMQGQNCYKLRTNSDNYMIEDKKFHNIINGSYIYQEVIKQHSKINEIYESAVNPLRIVTYLDDDNNIHHISSFMTFGIGKKNVSNNSSGGIFIPVDLNEGKLIGEAVQYLEYGGLQCTNHPNSGVEFDGFKVPFFEESLKIIEKAVEYLPIKLSGWDIAITEDGPCIIEGNSFPSMASMDIGYGGLKSHPILGEVIEKF
ncbi:sugar-transfer associated ATP-grasp domain-containing protein [Anaerosalibacter bizertensis]|nr:sugar-transfer associated ATP-grasp domain-containing protein [Anaerosalibacter bizertensis]